MSSASAATVEACPFEETEAARRAGQQRLTCAHCDRPLQGRQRKWCSTACSNVYAANHYWTTARHACLKRDGHRCRRCGAGWGRKVLLTGLMAVLLPSAGLSAVDVEFWLWRCFPDETARDQATSLEVNHIAPRRGKGYGSGCWNHLDNLETLCHQCHVDVTTAQRRGYRGSGEDLPRMAVLLPFPK